MPAIAFVGSIGVPTEMCTSEFTMCHIFSVALEDQSPRLLRAPTAAIIATCECGLVSRWDIHTHMMACLAVGESLPAFLSSLALALSRLREQSLACSNLAALNTLTLVPTCIKMARVDVGGCCMSFLCFLLTIHKLVAFYLRAPNRSSPAIDISTVSAADQHSIFSLT